MSPISVSDFKAAANSSLPSKQTAIVVDQKGDNFKLRIDHDYPMPEVKPGDVLVRLTSSGICHSDLSFIKDSWRDLVMTAKVPGHEGSGYVVGWGDGVDHEKFPKGMPVGVPLVHEPCRNCPSCNLPDGEVCCASTQFYACQLDGTWQQYITVRASYLIPFPEMMNPVVVGPILCGGVTAYKALKASGAKAGQWVVITGAGGGLGSMGIQYATALGLRVIAVDGGSEKDAVTKKLGAEVYIDFTKQNTVEAVAKATGGLGASAAIMFAPYESSYNQGIDMVGVQGTVVCVGLPEGDVEIRVAPAKLIFKLARIVGTLVGTRVDIIEALDFAARGKVSYPYHVVKPEQVVETLEQMAKGKLVGRAIIDLS